jgi:hypothetical protein
MQNMVKRRTERYKIAINGINILEELFNVMVL